MNKIILMGRLTRDVDVRYTQTTNTMIANFSLAVNRRFVKEGEERQADFFNVTAFGKTAEFIQKYMNTKGQQIAVIGRLQNRSWEDDQGQKHYATDVIAEEVYFADSKKQQNENNMTELQNHLDNAGVEFNTSDDLPF